MTTVEEVHRPGLCTHVPFNPFFIPGMCQLGRDVDEESISVKLWAKTLFAMEADREKSTL